jgi:hypothetical protein
MAMALALMASAASAQPVKVYLFAGQSNMDGVVNKTPLRDYGYGVYSWVTNAANPTLYHYWRSGGTTASTNWVHLNTPATLGWEHVVAFRLWNYWQARDTNQQIAIFKVSQGSTSLNSFWNPGGRDRNPWFYSPSPPYFVQGAGYQILTNRLALALSQLTERGLSYEVAGLFWYQGEGDASGATGADNYPVLFTDLVSGWVDREGYTNDTPAEYGGSLRALCGLTHLPAVAGRISWQIKGSPAWGARSVWEGYLTQVRAAQVNYAADHAACAWVDVDDIPLLDFYHYTSENYVEVGERFAQAYLSACVTGGPQVAIDAPAPWAEFLPVETQLHLVGHAGDAAGMPVTNLQWSSMPSGLNAATSLVVWSAPTWTARVYSVGSASDTNAWTYATNHDARLVLEAVLSGGQRMAAQRWIRRAEDADADGLPDAWATNHWPGGGSGGPGADEDDDGASNQAEWFAGTNPTSGASALRVSELASSGSAITLSCASVPGVLYTVATRPDIADGAWSAAAGPQAATDDVVRLSFALTQAVERAVYAVEVVR